MLSPFPFDSGGTVTNRFLPLGIDNFQDAASFIRRLPYGRTHDRSNYLAVLDEKKGTCSTKHALLAKLGEEQQLPVSLIIGIYRMNEENTPGVGAVLEKYGLSFLPEAHCYLKIKAKRYDFTREGVTAKSPFDALLLEKTIRPDQTGNYKIKLHRQFLHRWADTEGIEYHPLPPLEHPRSLY